MKGFNKNRLSYIILFLCIFLSLTILNANASFVEYTPDASTVILDHFNGFTNANFVNGSLQYVNGLDGLNQAANFNQGNWSRYNFQGWYQYPSQGTVEMMIKPIMYGFLAIHFDWDTNPQDGGGSILNFVVNGSGKLEIGVWGAPAPHTGMVGNSTIPLNQWSKIAFTWGPNGSRLWINGQVDAFSQFNIYPALSQPCYAFIASGGGAGVIVDELRISSIERTFFNQIPIAVAGTDQTVQPGKIATLNGIGSYSPDQDYPLTYAWTIKYKPTGSQTIILNSNNVTATMMIDKPGNYTVELVVTDSLGIASIPSQVKINTSNSSPIANAGLDQVVNSISTIVQLDGTKSYDPDDDAITYTWAIVQQPIGSNVVLDNINSATPTFIPDQNGTYRISLIVNDSWGPSDVDEVIVSFGNIKPVAVAGTNKSCMVNDDVNLNGSGSSDANNDSLSYDWWIVTKPANSNTELFGSDRIDSIITPDVPGEYVVSLVVNDGILDSDPSNIAITAISIQDIITKLQQVIIELNGLSTDAFKNKNTLNVLTNKINACITKVSTGDYEGAHNQLQNDILKKMDGWANNGISDKDDWIITDARYQIYPLIMDVINLLAKLF